MVCLRMYSLQSVIDIFPLLFLKIINWPIEVFSGVILTYGSLKFFGTLKKPTPLLEVETRPSTIANNIIPQNFILRLFLSLETGSH